MIITIYGNGDVYIPDNLLGFVGETNHRVIDFEYDNVSGATNYEFRLLYPGGTAYSAPITNKKVTVTGSMLPAAGKIKGQWLAYTTDNEDEYTLVAKSEMFDLIIGDSIGDDAAPVPTYEASIAAAAALVEQGLTKEQIITAIEQIVESGEVTDLDSGFVTTLKEILHNQGFRVGIDTEAALKELADQGLMEENVLYIPTDEDTGWINLTLINGWTNYSFSGTEDDTPQTAQIRRIGNHVYIRGAIANSEISTVASVKKIFAVAPEGMKATRHVFSSTTGFGLTVSRLETNPSGDLFTRVVFDLEAGERCSSCTWMSIDMDYIID